MLNVSNLILNIYIFYFKVFSFFFFCFCVRGIFIAHIMPIYIMIVSAFSTTVGKLRSDTDLVKKIHQKFSSNIFST